MPGKGTDGFTVEVVFSQHLDHKEEFCKPERGDEVVCEEGKENTKGQRHRSVCLVRTRWNDLVRLPSTEDRRMMHIATGLEMSKIRDRL